MSKGTRLGRSELQKRARRWIRLLARSLLIGIGTALGSAVVAWMVHRLHP